MKKLFVLILLATATFTQAKNIYVAPNKTKIFHNDEKSVYTVIAFYWPVIF